MEGQRISMIHLSDTHGRHDAISDDDMVKGKKCFLFLFLCFSFIRLKLIFLFILETLQTKVGRKNTILSTTGWASRRKNINTLLS